MSKKLDESIALQLTVDNQLRVAESIYGVQHETTQVSVARVEIGWLFEFAPTRQFNDKGSRLFNLRFIVDDLEQRVHNVGTPGVQRALNRIKRRRD